MAYREDIDRGRYARGGWNEPNWRNEQNYGRGESFSRGGGWNEPNYGYGGAGGGYGGNYGAGYGGYGGAGGYGGYGRGNEWYSTSGRGPESYYGSNRGFEGYGQGYGQGGYGQGGYGQNYGRGNEWNYGMGRGNEPYYGYGRGEERMGFAGEFRNPSWSRESQYGGYGGYQGYQGNQGLGNYPGYGGYSWSGYGGGAGETTRFTTRDRGYGSELGRGELGRGSHYGRGPRNYRRSDDRIEEDINEQLTRHPEIDATEIEVNVDNGEVTLTGTVDNRNAKRTAEDVAESVSGVRDVHNQIRVSSGATGAGGAAGEREVARPTEREGRGRETQRAGRGTTRSGATAGGT